MSIDLFTVDGLITLLIQGIVLVMEMNGLENMPDATAVTQTGDFSEAKARFSAIDRSEARARYAQQAEPGPQANKKLLAEQAMGEEVPSDGTATSSAKSISMPATMSIEVFNNIYNEVRTIKAGVFAMQDLMDKRLGVPILRSAS